MIDPEHPWLREAGEASDIPIASAALGRMKQFGAKEACFNGQFPDPY